MAHNKHDNIKTYGIAVILVAAGVFFDQWTKYLAVTNLKNQPPIILINKVFQLCYLENRGAAFGMLQNKIIFFLICTPVIMAIMIILYSRLPMENKYLPLRFCAIFITAGAIGNMIDRLRLGYVIDFFYFNLIDFPIFNVADIYVTVATFVLILLTFFYYKEEDFDRIFQRKK